MSFRGGGGGGGRFGSSSRGGRGGGRNYTVSTKLFIGNIPETCRRVDLQKVFEKYGTVTECDIVKNYGFVHYDSESDAKMAQEALDGTEFQGENLKVELSHSRVRQKPGMGGKQECYKCGKEGHWSKDCPKGPSRPPMRGVGDRGRDPYARDPYSDPYYSRDRYLPPMDRFRPYADPYDRRPPPPRDPYYRESLRDPYARPPPEYYGRSPSREFARDAYYDSYYERRGYAPPPPGTSRMSPPRTRVAPY